MAKKPSRAARRRSALKGWRTRRKNERSAAKRTSQEKEAVRGRSGRAAARKRKQKLITRPSRVSKEFQRRSAAAKLGWKRRKRLGRLSHASVSRKQRGKRVVPQKAQPPKLNREYFVVLLFKTRKNGKMVDRRLREAIVTLPDGASDEEIKKAYAQWMLENSDYSAQDIYKLVFADNRGRHIDMRIVPRSEPTASEAGTIRDNDARSRTKRKTKKRKA